LKFAKEHNLPWVVIGNGTNILFPDKGYKGVVIKLSGMRERKLNGDMIRLGAGVSLGGVINHLHAYCFNDFDFLVGIPGTVGGALAMNAGIPQGTISDLVKEVKALTPDGEIVTLSKEMCRFSYRTSLFQQEKIIILEGLFKLGCGKEWDIKELIQRRANQPRLPSPGCVFKNPPGSKAGELIDKAGLKGYKIGEAVISTTHANFIVNEGGARCADVLKLIDFAQEKVYKDFGINLELELEVIAEN
jgi:UDP-N-acetylmuramate dehydrogenase